jgi:Family of unknown function (DUF6390)
VAELPAGARLFAQYAYAPNQLGYCGPADSAALFELAVTGQTAADVTAIASRFTGAWPYLCVLAELTGIADPLDARLVRAYWTGSALLDGVDRARFGRMLLSRIGQAGARQYWAHLTAALLPEAAPTHCFHVFGVYPWTRLLLSPGGATSRTARGAADGSATVPGAPSPGGATPRTARGAADGSATVPGAPSPGGATPRTARGAADGSATVPGAPSPGGGDPPYRSRGEPSPFLPGPLIWPGGCGACGARQLPHQLGTRPGGA